MPRNTIPKGHPLANLGTASRPIPPTDSPEYLAIQQALGTKELLGLLVTGS